jgi:NAD(P)-dependent dehydrogenase (short-subunit alcohol dehydrogenase family)
MVKECIAGLGGLDMLVNNAGIVAAGNVVELAVEDWRRVIGVNLTAVYLMRKFVTDGGCTVL